MVEPRRKYIGILALVAALILLGGWWLRPVPDAARSPEPTPTDLERLAQLAQRRSIDDSIRYFAGVADRAGASLVGIADGRTGVVWQPALVVTSSPPAPAAEALEVIGPSGPLRAPITGGGPRVPIVIARPDSLAASPVVRGAVRDLPPGGWVIAVWRGTNRRAFATGHLVGVRGHAESSFGWQEPVSTIALTPEMLGGGLFDLDGRLLGIVVSVDGRLAVLGTDSIDSFIGRAAALDERLLARFGMWVAPLSADERAHLQLDAGLIVREVWDAYAADREGLAPGDVIVALADQPVDALAGLELLATAPSSELPPLTVQWRRTRREVWLAPAPSAPVTVAGLAWESPARGYRVASVAPGSRAASAGLRSGDAILRVDRVAPGTVNEIDRLLSGDSGPRRYLEVRRGGHRFGTVY